MTNNTQHTEVKANAHLIDAAADLLKILTRISEAYKISEGSDQSVVDFMDAMDDIADDMQAAIAKARGNV